MGCRHTGRGSRGAHVGAPNATRLTPSCSFLPGVSMSLAPIGLESWCRDPTALHHVRGHSWLRVAPGPGPRNTGNHCALWSPCAPKAHPTRAASRRASTLPRTLATAQPSWHSYLFFPSRQFFLIGSLLITPLLCRGNKQQLETRAAFLLAGASPCCQCSPVWLWAGMQSLPSAAHHPALHCPKAIHRWEKPTFLHNRSLVTLKRASDLFLLIRTAIKKAFLINIITLFERSSLHLADTFQTKDAGCRSQSSLSKTRCFALLIHTCLPFPIANPCELSRDSFGLCGPLCPSVLVPISLSPCPCSSVPCTLL